MTWSGVSQLENLLVPIESLQHDAANVREHSSRNIEAIKESLSLFGQQKPVVVGGDNVVYAGNGTLQAARELGWSQLAAIKTNLSGAKIRAYAIADNKTTDLSEWNFENLAEVLRALPPEELTATGFVEHELQPLLAADWSPLDIADDKQDPLGHTVRFSNEQWASMLPAIEQVCQDDGKANDAECLVRVCQQYVSQ